ncbi:hypothetical protein WA026_018397 [Henosepilachna vigintioctopunctata]|uniref:Allorecognition 2 n=1 Tax=Henosepilachna vigintioctopunctata TaxID=420089 RepID=A0AAW1V3F6_9CUCU
MFSSRPVHIIFVILQIFILVQSEDYRVELNSNGPIVRGATIRFTATLYHGDGLASGSYDYFWTDDAIPPHSTKITSSDAVVSWEVNYDSDLYPPGPYEVQVIIKKDFYIIYYAITSGRIHFKILDTLSGTLHLTQNNVTRDTQYISSATSVTAAVNLTQPDSNFVRNATSVTTFWFIDCIYYGPTINGHFSHLFPVSGEEHSIDALMVADFNPPPPPLTTTTTSTSTTMKPSTTVFTTTVQPTVTTTSKSNSSTNHSTTPTVTNASIKVSSLAPLSNETLKNVLHSNINAKTLQKRSTELHNTTVERKQKIMEYVNGTLVPYNGSFPYICNGTVAVGNKKSYGYFNRKVIVKAPIASVKVTGNDWLQHGDILTLNVACDGAPSLRYCVKFARGIYNATGNETCEVYLTMESCSFLIQRYLWESAQHTVIIIIENDVTKVVKTVAVTVYKVKKQAQLSVIVVPVAFSLVAVVLVIFGLAYYIQNRNRFIVEVADFHFGVDYSDMEYKTFRERLQESFVNAFTRAPSPDPSEAPNWSFGHSQKYGSMT